MADREALATRVSLTNVAAVLLGLRAPLSQRGEPLLPLEAGTPLPIRQVQRLCTEDRGGEQQLLEGAVVLPRRVLGFIMGQGTKAAVLGQRSAFIEIRG